MAIPGNTIILILLMVSIIGIGVFIQVKLSRSDNKFLGLILPIISFLFSLMMLLSIASFSLMTTSVDGVVQSTEKIQDGMNYLSMFFIFLMTNIPTVILMGIYIGERKKIKTSKWIEKMKIEDL